MSNRIQQNGDAVLSTEECLPDLPTYGDDNALLTQTEVRAVNLLAEKFIDATLDQTGTDEAAVKDVFVKLHQVQIGFEGQAYSTGDMAVRWQSIRNRFSDQVHTQVVMNRSIDYTNSSYDPFRAMGDTSEEKMTLVGNILEQEMDSAFSQFDYTISKALWQSHDTTIDLGISQTDALVWGGLDFIGEHPVLGTLVVGGALIIQPFAGPIEAFLAGLGTAATAVITGAGALSGVVSAVSLADKVNDTHTLAEQKCEGDASQSIACLEASEELGSAVVELGMDVIPSVYTVYEGVRAGKIIDAKNDAAKAAANAKRQQERVLEADRYYQEGQDMDENFSYSLTADLKKRRAETEAKVRAQLLDEKNADYYGLKPNEFLYWHQSVDPSLSDAGPTLVKYNLLTWEYYLGMKSKVDGVEYIQWVKFDPSFDISEMKKIELMDYPEGFYVAGEVN